MKGEDLLRRLLHAGRALVAHRDVDLVLDELLGTARELTGASYAAIGVLADGGGLERFVTSGVDAAEHEAIGGLPRGRGVLGVLIEDPRPLRLTDVGDHPKSYGFPAGHPPMRTFLGVPILVGDQAYGNLYLTEKAGGGPFTADDEDVAVGLASWAATAIGTARLLEASERRGHDAEAAVRRLEATTAIARAVGSETDLQRVLELIVKRARALIDARAVLLLLAEGEELLLAAGAGQVDGRAVGRRIARAGSAMGGVLAAGRAEHVADAAVRLELDDEDLGVVGAETALLVPLMYRGRGLGVLAAFDPLDDGDGGFDGADQELVEAFAASAATAVATAQSAEREQLRRSVEAAERERRRWADQLHEGTLQGLGALRVLLSTGLRSGDQQTLVTAAREAVVSVGEEIARLRSLISELRPAALDQLGLGPAIESLVEHASGVHAVESRVRVSIGPGRLPPELETTVYRIVQEAVANALRHGHPRELGVTIHRTDESVVLEVTDDGRGFDATAPGAGFGLAAMRERASLHAGVLQVDSSPAGTRVGVTFALPEPRPGPLPAGAVRRS